MIKLVNQKFGTAKEITDLGKDHPSILRHLM